VFIGQSLRNLQPLIKLKWLDNNQTAKFRSQSREKRTVKARAWAESQLAYLITSGDELEMPILPGESLVDR